MLTPLVAHVGRPPGPHDLWTAWNLDPLLVGGLVVAAVVYVRGRTRGPARQPGTTRAAAFALALAAVTVALVSPLEAASSALASAHMVQHVVLILVAAPLLALSAPSTTLLLGLPPAARRALFGWSRRLHVNRRNRRLLHHPATTWILHVAVLWFWHASAPYDAALANEGLHVVEHSTFLVTAVLFWQSVVGARAHRVSKGLGVLLVFTMGMQSVLLSLLLTFARSPWYAGYRSTTEAWGLDPLTDQQLAGVIMWVPAGVIYIGASLALFVAWLWESEGKPPAAPPRRPGGQPLGCRP